MYTVNREEANKPMTKFELVKLITTYLREDKDYDGLLIEEVVERCYTRGDVCLLYSEIDADDVVELWGSDENPERDSRTLTMWYIFDKKVLEVRYDDKVKFTIGFNFVDMAIMLDGDWLWRLRNGVGMEFFKTR